MRELNLIEDTNYTRLKSPIAVIYEVTHYCNLRCAFCYSESERGKPVDTSVSRVAEILTAIKKAEVLHVSLMGGELHLLDACDRVIRLAAEMGFRLSLVSNGTLLDAGKARVISEYVDSCGISFRGPNPSIHDRITGIQGSFLKALEGLRNLRNAGATVGLIYDPIAENYTNLFDTAELVMNKHGIPLDFVSANRIAPRGRALHNLSQTFMPLRQYVEVLDQLERIEREFSIPVEISDAFPLCLLEARHHRLITRCEFGAWQATIGPDGGLRGCPCSNHHFGNVVADGLETIWRTSPLVARHLDMEWLPDQCRSCSMLAQCGGGCPQSDPDSQGDSVDAFYRSQAKAVTTQPREPSLETGYEGFAPGFADDFKPKLAVDCWFRDDLPGIICIPLDTMAVTFIRGRPYLIVDDLERSVMQLCRGEHSVKEISRILSSQGLGPSVALTGAVRNILGQLRRFGYLEAEGRDKAAV